MDVVQGHAASGMSLSATGPATNCRISALVVTIRINWISALLPLASYIVLDKSMARKVEQAGRDP